MLAQPAVDTEQKFKYRATPHGRGFLRIAGKPEGQRAALHGRQAVADLDRGSNAAAGGDAVFDARQLAQEASAGGDDETIIADVFLFRDDATAVILQAGDSCLVVVDLHTLEKISQRDYQVLGLA